MDTASIAKNPLRRFVKHYKDADTYRVKAITLSEIIELYNVDGGVLKMDCEGCEYDVILNDFEHVALFDELIFEYHAHATGMPVQSLLRILSKSFNCRVIEGGSTQGIVHCTRK